METDLVWWRQRSVFGFLTRCLELRSGIQREGQVWEGAGGLICTCRVCKVYGDWGGLSHWKSYICPQSLENEAALEIQVCERWVYGWWKGTSRWPRLSLSTTSTQRSPGLIVKGIGFRVRGFNWKKDPAAKSWKKPQSPRCSLCLKEPQLQSAKEVSSHSRKDIQGWG